MDLELGEHYYVRFNNPDIVTYAESFGAKGYRINSADELLPTLKGRRWIDAAEYARMLPPKPATPLSRRRQ